MKLKTLNDLIKEADELSFGGYTEDTLKEEAIKWIKELERANKSHTLDLCKYTAHGSDSSTNSNLVNWIKDFFNITDEELK